MTFPGCENNGAGKLLLAGAIATLLSSSLLAQGSHKSPVFKDYRPPSPGSLIEQSDITYQLWQTFILTRKANSGDVLAQQELAVRYLLGKGVKADTAKGAYWTLRAASQNLLQGRFNLGILLTNGWGVEWNPFQAFEHFSYCADHGMQEAQYVVGTMFMENLVVPRDMQQAKRWLRAAADSGYTPAAELLQKLQREGRLADGTSADTTALRTDSAAVRTSRDPTTLRWSPVFLDFGADTGSVADDATLLKDLLRDAAPEVRQALGVPDTISRLSDLDPSAIAALERAADAGSPEALTVLGRCYEKGIGVPRDRVVAVAHYVRAVRFDSPGALEALYRLLEEEGTVQTLRQRALGGDPAAGFSLATLSGLGINSALLQNRSWITEAEALHLLQAASGHGYVPAMIELGLWYYAGRGVPLNEGKAERLWEEAGREGSTEARVRVTAAHVNRGEGNPDSAVAVLRSAAREGSVLSQVVLGYCYENGFGVVRSIPQAVQAYRNAAERGSQDGYRALVRLYDLIRPAEARYQIRNEPLH